MNLAQLSLKCFSLLLPLLAISVTACQSLTIQPSPPAPEVRSDTQLVLNNAILQQSNQEDNTVWKIKADNIVYSEDKQTAALSQIVGNLWQDDSIILKVSAKRGKIKDNGNTILLNEEVIVSDPRNNSVINSDALEWRPQDNILLIEEALRGTHPNLEVTANSGIYLTDVEQLVVQGDVVATTDQPSLQLTSDRLEWSISQNKVNSPGAIKLARYDAAQNITEKLVSDRAEVDLIAHTATLNQNVELIT
ncbi:MAG: LPS export ABC transporter periplasmic protein LptC, partial [Cyanobacteria bacterium J06558_2]